MEPITIGWMLSTVLSGYIGNRSDHFLCKGTNLLYKRIKEKIDEPTNHHVQKAVRKSYLQSTLLAAEFVKKTKKRFSDERTDLSSAINFLKKEIEKTESENPLVRASTLDNEYREILFPKENFSSEERLDELVKELKDSIIAEFRAIKMPMVDDFLDCIYNGWEEKGKRMDFYQLTCAFFNDELKKNPKVSTIIQTEYLDEISSAVGIIELKISDLNNSIEAYYELYKEFIPIVKQILDTVEEIRDDTKEIKVDVKEIKDILLEKYKFNSQQGDYKKITNRIKELNDKIGKTVENIKDKKELIIEATDKIKANLEEDIQELNEKLIQINIELETAKNEKESFINNFINTAEIIAKQKSILDEEEFQEIEKLFAEGKYKELDSYLDESKIDKEIEKLEKSLSENKKRNASKLILKAQTILLTKPENWFEDANRLYEKAVSISENYNTTFNYAYFLAEHNQINKAIELYTKTLSYYTDDTEKATVLNNLGNLQADKNDFEKAEISYNRVLEIFQKLAEKNPEAFLPDVAITLNNLGNLQYNKNEFDKAEISYNKALEIREKLAVKNPEAFLPRVADTLNNLGVLQADKNDFEKAETSYNKALEIREKLAEKNPETFLPDVAMTLNNLGTLQYNKNEFDKAEISYNKALEIYQKFSEKNPEAFLPRVADTLNNLGVLQRNKNEFDKAEISYNRALEIYQKLAEMNPEAFLPRVADTLNNLGLLQANKNDFEKAEISYNKALEIREKLAGKNPEAFLSSVADTLYNLGNLQYNKNDFEKAEISYNKALEIREKLAEKNPEAFLPRVAKTLNNLGNLQADKNDFEKAEISYNRALEIRKKLTEINPEAFLLELSRTKVLLALLYKDNIADREKSIHFAREAIEDASTFLETSLLAQQLVETAQEILDYWENEEKENS